MNRASIAMGVVATVVAGLAYVYVDSRDSITEKQAAIEAAWEQVSAVIAARSELIPALATTVQQNAPRERALMMNLIEARAAVEMAQGRRERIPASMRLTASLAALMAEAEKDPALKDDAGFKRLQDQLADAENRMAVGRRRYNEAVHDYNTYIQLSPHNFVSGMAGFAREESYFRTTEAARLAPPRVRFSPEPTPEDPIPEE